jgi:cyclic beta-1,2-glucan synthetase
MYRLATETLLGIHLETDRLRIEPLLPDGWEGFAIHYRYRDTFCHIKVRRAGGGPGRVGKVVVDDAEQPDLRVPLVDDRREHNVEIQVLPAAG